MTWILLRGLTREARHWGGFTAQLAAQLGEEVLTPDLPGSGEFFREPSPGTVRGMLEAVRRQILARGEEPPFAVLGMSMGGMMAADWAQHYPQEVSRLVLVNTSMRPFSGITQRLRPTNWPALAGLAAQWGDAAQAERTIHRLTCERVDEKTLDLAAWMGIRSTSPVSAANALRQLWAAATFECRPEAPPCPVLVLSSANDRLVSPACSAQLAAAWQATHVQHPWAGHDLPHDDGPWTCAQVAQWLSA